MKYITSVVDALGTRHIIDCGNGNVEVRADNTTESYGNKKEVKRWSANGVKIFDDLTINHGRTDDGFHLAQFVLAVEQVRFVQQHLLLVKEPK